MRSSSARLALPLFAAFTACGGAGGGASTAGPASSTSPTPAAANVMDVTVNGALCSAGSYPNKPCVEVTLCVPGTSTCQTVDDVLLDTGSYGLRLFKQALTIALPRVPAGAGTLASCVQFADGSSQWGPVANASVVLAGEPAVEVPVQIIDATFGTVPASCTKPDLGPLDAGFNGVLGVGVFAQDCGPACAQRADNGLYFACDAAGCQGVAVPVASQIQNPVSLLPGDGNGLIVELPGVAQGGAPSSAGSVTLGIGTRPNNAPSGATAYPLDGNGMLGTLLGGAARSGFLDTGSNGLFFAAPPGVALPTCPVPDDPWFCPASTLSLSATNSAASGSPSSAVAFQIGNFEALLSTPNNVFAEVGGRALPSEGFDWGLPFYLGRRVYLGIENQTSALGVGPYVAY